MNRLPLRFLIGFSAILFLALTLPAQKFRLILQNSARFRRDQIEPGKIIGAQLKGQETMYFGQLKKVNADWIFMNNDSLRVENVAKIHIAKPRFYPDLVRKASATGRTIYPLMVIINNPLKSWTWKQPKQILGILLGDILLQRLMRRFYWRRVKLNKGKWELKVMPTVESYF